MNEKVEETQPTYVLTFLFDGKSISKDPLTKRLERAVVKRLPKISLNIKSMGGERLEVSIKGSLEDIEFCRDKINTEFSSEQALFAPLTDEAADELRQKAYPILSKIEKSLRKFITQAMTEVYGFNWWGNRIPFATQQKVQSVAEKIPQKHEIYHPLELTYFNDLVDIVTARYQEWSEDRPLSTADLKEVLSECDSVDEVQSKLAKKTRAISLWDEVFARYFDNKSKWEELEKSIRRVVQIRDKVMHHRQVKRHELEKLTEIEKQVEVLLASAKPELTEQDRDEVHQIIEPLILEMQRQLAEVDMNSQFARAADVAKDFDRLARIAVLRQEESLHEVMSRMNSQFARAADEIKNFNKVFLEQVSQLRESTGQSAETGEISELDQ